MAAQGFKPISNIRKIENWRKFWYDIQNEKQLISLRKIGENKKTQSYCLANIFKEDNLILDAVHSNLEWEIIKMMIPNAELVEFVTPKKVREERRISKYKLDAKDSSRIKYWHNPNGVSKCLISDVDWVFNGVLPNELNLLRFEEFISFSNSLKYKDLDIEKNDIYDRILMMKGLRK